MPRRTTRQASPYERPRRLAVGLHCPVRKRPFFFEGFKNRLGRPKAVLTIGRKPGSDIRVKDDYVSSRHALLRRQSDGSMHLVPDSPRNGLYVDGVLITEPVVLTVGMRLHLGHSRLIATDEFGRFKYSADDYDHYLAHGAEYYGSCRLAGKQIGRSHETVRVRCTVRPCRGHRCRLPKRPRRES